MCNVEFVMKNGYSFNVKCEKYSVKRNNITGDIISYNLYGIEGDAPLYINMSDISCIIKRAS